MKNEETTLSAQDSLRVIQETIDLAKHSVRENGFQFLLWGWLIVLACIGEYCLRIFNAGVYAYLVWLVLPVIGLPVSLLHEYKGRRKRSSRNIIRQWYGLIWAAFAVLLSTVMVWVVPNATSPVPFILILAAFATFLSGVVLRFPPLKWGAFALWGGAIACMNLAAGQHVLIMAGVTIAGYLVPGYLLKAKSGKDDA